MIHNTKKKTRQILQYENQERKKQKSSDTICPKAIP